MAITASTISARSTSASCRAGVAWPRCSRGWASRSSTRRRTRRSPTTRQPTWSTPPRAEVTPMKPGTAYYDLSVSPPTFNAFDFLLAAELWRLEQGLDGLDVRVLPGPVEGFRADQLP